MRLTFYNRPGREAMIRVAQPKRAWMDETFESFAYRCLPLTIANSHGWEILCPASFEAVWDGGEGLDAVRVTPTEPVEDRAHLPTSDFGHGVLTFHTHGVFRTDPGYDLWVTGPPNTPIDGLAPLTGVVESDWINASFTMNWQFTAPDTTVTFELGDPFCFLFPVKRGFLEEVEVETRRMEDEPEQRRRYEAWVASRDRHNVERLVPGTEAAKRKWEKHYYQGRNVDGSPGAPDHRQKLRLREF